MVRIIFMPKSIVRVRGKCVKRLNRKHTHDFTNPNLAVDPDEKKTKVGRKDGEGRRVRRSDPEDDRQGMMTREPEGEIRVG